jgi:hypothetical protein
MRATHRRINEHTKSSSPCFRTIKELFPGQHSRSENSFSFLPANAMEFGKFPDEKTVHEKSISGAAEGLRIHRRLVIT